MKTTRSGNALTGRMYFGIRRAIDVVMRDPDLQALIITGVQDVFCLGGDLRWYVQVMPAHFGFASPSWVPAPFRHGGRL